MDNGEGRMTPLNSIDPDYVDTMRKMYPKSRGIFTVGEEIEIRGSRFKVKDISPFGIKLKLLKTEE